MMCHQINKATIELVKRFEGLRLNPYLCPANVPTIGYGTTVYPNGKKVSLKDPPITEEKAEEYLLHDLQEFAKGVAELVTVPLNENQFGALVSFSYNVGTNALKNSTLLRRLNSGDYAGAAEQFLRWVYGGGKVLPGLVKRREAERSLFLHPIN